jgi:mannose-6-phosphate isomerase-like protein (cupin superfamily)
MVMYTMSMQQNTNQSKIDTVCVTGANKGEMGLSGPVSPALVPKRWGSEIHYANNENYCMKLLIIEPGDEKLSSMHFHLDKHETMLVVEGTLCITYIVNKIELFKLVELYEAFTIAPGLPHRLTAYGDKTCRLVEASMPDHDQDSIRIY